MPKTKNLSYPRYLRLVGAALAAGAKPKANGSLEWDLSNGCYNPFVVTCRADNRNATQNRYIDLHMRCRKCEPCLKARGHLWRLRMEAETRAAPRTWMLTLTLNPERQSWASLAAQHKCRKRGWAWTEITEALRFRETCNVISPEITRYLKRVRESSQAELRFCLIAEKHKSGLPHYHALIHEVDPDKPVRHRHLTGCWRWGFSVAKLVADHDATRSSIYVSKYLSKAIGSRVRASRGYGTATADPQGSANAPAGELPQGAKLVDPQAGKASDGNGPEGSTAFTISGSD